jgi:hypothetical protein
VVPSAVAQCICFKFVTNENVETSEILIRSRAGFSDKTLLRIHIRDCSKSFKEGRTEVENMRRLHLLQEKVIRDS